MPERSARTRPGGTPTVCSVAAAVVRTGPDKAEAVAFLVLNEIGVDRDGEAWIIELEAQVGAPLVGLFAPAGADLDPADEDAMAWGIIAYCAGGSDADVTGLEGKGDDLTGELVGAGLPEGADGSHDSSPWLLVRVRAIAVSMAIGGRR